MKVRIIGSGITGITTAYYLAKNNHQVTIADERRYPAMATSYANGCQISASNSETWNSWKNIIQGSKWLFKKDAPLLISLKPDLNKYKWFIKFINAISDRKDNTLETCKMALHSGELYKIIAKELSEEKAVGWCQGRLEFGPRALGKRSIIADARSSFRAERSG